MARRTLGRRGATLLETVLAVLIMSTVGLALIAMVQKIAAVSFKAREQMTCERMQEAGFARLKNIDFYYLFAVDSSSANFGGLHASYPYMSTLNALKTSMSAAKFDRFTVGVTFMRRDTTDANGNGLTSDLIAFTDLNNDGVDDYDPAIKYYDQNGDGDYYETYASNGRTVAEQPDTHIKQVTLNIYRYGRLACAQTQLISLEQFQPENNPSSESSLSLSVSTPSNNGYLYRANTTALAASRALALVKSYPSTVLQYRADSVSPLQVSGTATPLATANLYVGSSGILDTLSVDTLGDFSGTALNVTTSLVEGSNLFTAQATKSTYSSALQKEILVLDLAPPTVTSPTPAGTTSTLAPYVAAVLSDPGISTTTTSGICPDVISMKINGSTVSYRYDSSTGLVVWIDSTTETVPVVSSGTYTAYVEVGDYAGYRSTQAWTFTASVSDTDNSAPSVANKSPIGGTATSDLPEISVRVFDNQTGIIPSSIQMTVDGATVVNSANIASAYDPNTGTVSYTPSSSFAAGSTHTVTITASHFATNPADKVTSVDSWTFFVP